MLLFNLIVRIRYSEIYWFKQTITHHGPPNDAECLIDFTESISYNSQNLKKSYLSITSRVALI